MREAATQDKQRIRELEVGVRHVITLLATDSPEDYVVRVTRAKEELVALVMGDEPC